MSRPIAISLSPNVSSVDLWSCLKMIIQPWKYIVGSSVLTLEQWFENYFNEIFAIAFDSGREALYSILKSLTIGEGDEVILQAFTCVAVPNAVIKTGAIPIYCDIDSSLTISPKEIEKHITQKTKAIIVQHTFGIPTDMGKVKKIADKYKLFIIEDCAHVIGGTFNNKKLGTFGDAAIFSFGRDKAFSSVFGGMVITNNKKLGEKLRSVQRGQKDHSLFWVFQQILHPIAFSIILPFYNTFSTGKFILVTLQKLKLLSFPVTQKDKQGIADPVLGKRLSNALAYLALVQLKRIKEFNTKRESFGNYYVQHLSKSFEIPYREKSAFLRFAVLTPIRDQIIASFKQKNILLGKWYSEVIDPQGVEYEKIYYMKGSCLIAEKTALEILNLPTYPSLQQKDIEHLVHLLNSYDN